VHISRIAGAFLVSLKADPCGVPCVVPRKTQ